MSEILLYKTANQEVKLEVLIQNKTIWLNQKQISEVFNVKVPAVSKHLKNIFEGGELDDEEVVVSKMEIVHQESSRKIKREVDFDNLILGLEKR